MGPTRDIYCFHFVVEGCFIALIVRQYHPHLLPAPLTCPVPAQAIYPTLILVVAMNHSQCERRSPPNLVTT